MNNCDINNNSISGSNSASRGGLSFLYIDNMLIDNCEITGNSVESDWSGGGGIGISTEGNVTIRNTIINDNIITGSSSSVVGGIGLSEGNFIMENCEIGNNVTSCGPGAEFSGGGGINLSTGCSLIAENLLIHDNISGEGAAIRIYDSSDCLLVNCTVSNNESDVNGGIYTVGGGRLGVINTIFWNNDDSEIWIDDHTECQIHHCIIEEGEDGILCTNGGSYFWGEANLELDPLFMDAVNGDFHLLEGSPGIDSGMCAYLDWDYNTHLIPEEEIIGRHRDMGVFETGIEDNIFDLPAYLVTDEDYSISLDLEEYLGGLSGDITIYNEDHLQCMITGNLITWQPEEDWFGFDEVWIDLETDTGETYSDYVLIDVTGINDAPEINLPESVSFNNTGRFRMDVEQYIYDAEGVLLRITGEGSEHINAWVQVPNLLMDAEPGWQGTETITVYAEDEWQRLLSSDTMQVIVYCEPVADCGENLYGRDGAQIILDGSASLDPLLNGLNYYWSTDNEIIIDNADSVLAIVTTPEIEEMAEALIYLEVNDGYNSSIDSLYLSFYDDEPLNVECNMFPANNTIRLNWDEPIAAGMGQIELLGYQMYFEGCEFDSLQNTSELIYSFTLPEGDYDFGVQAVYNDGRSDIVETSSVDANESELVLTPGINKIYPNPFNPEVTISFSTTEHTEHTEIKIYNIKGQCIRDLKINYGKREMGEGRWNVVWDGKDDKGRQVGSGMYFVRLKINNELFTNKVVLLK